MTDADRSPARGPARPDPALVDRASMAATSLDHPSAEALAEALWDTDPRNSHLAHPVTWKEWVTSTGQEYPLTVETRAWATAILARLFPPTDAAPAGPGLAGAVGVYLAAQNALCQLRLEFGVGVSEDELSIGDRARWCSTEDAEQAARAALNVTLAGGAGGGWQDISTAPYGEEVEVRVGEMQFRAKLVRDASINSEEQSCDQWQATREGEHPPCWTDGACWESNEDLSPSLHPEAWRQAAPPRAGQDGGEADGH